MNFRLTSILWSYDIKHGDSVRQALQYFLAGLHSPRLVDRRTNERMFVEALGESADIDGDDGVCDVRMLDVLDARIRRLPLYTSLDMQSLVCTALLRAIDVETRQQHLCDYVRLLADGFGVDNSRTLSDCATAIAQLVVCRAHVWAIMMEDREQVMIGCNRL
jgi:hypothetical protein